jgi:hypothetical protein
MLATQRLSVRQGATTRLDAEAAAADLHAQIHQDDASFTLFFCSPDYDLEKLGPALKECFGDTPIIGCTTAGEITPMGYLTGSLTGVSVASPDFTAVVTRIEGVDEFEFADGEAAVETLLDRLARLGTVPDGSNTFGFLLVDGLCRREETVVGAIHRALGPIQLLGGSAADGVEFGSTSLYHDGRFRSNVALLTMIQTSHPFVVFKTQHFVGDEAKMVVTEANPSMRLVTEINGAPAAVEYARMVGLPVDTLDTMVFAAHPVTVSVGGETFVRSILSYNPDGSLTFACAIDEGIVLTVARGVDMVDNLRAAFDEVRSSVGPPALVLGCDCLFRAIEMDQKGLRDAIGSVMSDNNVVGFATYGEQFNAMHVNQTFTGVAIGGGAAVGL